VQSFSFHVASWLLTATIVARNGGSIDLSGLEEITPPAGDTVRVLTESGGAIDLSGLESAQDTVFAIDAASYSLPMLDTAADVVFDVVDGQVFSVPVLATHSGGSLTVQNGGTLTAPSLTGVTGASITVIGTGVLTAGALASIGTSTIALQDSASVTLPSLTTLTAVTANPTILEADGAGSVLDVSGMQSFSFHVASWLLTATIVARNGGSIDLSGLLSIPTPGGDNVTILADGAGSEIDLSLLNPVPAGVTLTEQDGGNIINPTLPAKPAKPATRARSVAGDFAIAIAELDLNGDGIADSVAADSETDEVLVCLGSDYGMFSVEQRLGVGDYPVAVAVADLNADGILDIVTANYGSADVSALLGIGDGAFCGELCFAVGEHPESVSAYDVDDDGTVDIITTHVTSGDVTVLLGGGDGSFRRE